MSAEKAFLKKIKGGYSLVDDETIYGGQLDEATCVADKPDMPDPRDWYDWDDPSEYTNDQTSDQYEESERNGNDGYKDYRNDWNKLSDREKEFIKEHPIVAYDFHKNAQHASAEARQRFPDMEGRDDARDAFRHALWSALDAYDHGRELADEYADAHEEENDPLQSDEAREMDNHNNEVGIEIGEEARENGWDEDRIIEEILDALEDGRLITLK